MFAGVYVKSRQRDGEYPGQVSLMHFPMVLQCQEKGNTGKEM